MSTYHARLTSPNLYTGEIRRKGINITKSEGTLSLSAATVTLYNWDGTVDTAEASATISGGNVYALITAGTTPRKLYAIFKAVDGTPVIKGRLDFSVVQG